MEWALGLAAILAVVAVVFVARPFLRDPAPASDRLDELAPEARKRLALAEERDRALAALKIDVRSAGLAEPRVSPAPDRSASARLRPAQANDAFSVGLRLADGDSKTK